MDNLKRKTIISTLSLFFQSGYSALLGLVANLVLTIVVSPTIFGIYITVLSLIAILNYFSDIGLAASLIQKKEVTLDDEKTAFTVQQILVISLVTLGFLFSHAIISFYKLPSAGLYLYWALLVGFFLSSLKTIPSVFLERNIKFQKIVIVTIIENTLFYITVIILALLGYGLTSFTVAVLIRSISGVIIIYRLSPWTPTLGINKQSLKTLVSFGLPFQTTSLLALVKDDLMNLFLGKLLGFQLLGYIGWAKKWAEAPIRIVMDNLNRILFPLFSRLQQNKEKLTSIVEKTIFYQSLLIIPTITGAFFIMDKFIDILPKYGKWQPALPLFYLFCLSALLSSFSTPFTNLLNGIGQVKISFYFMVFWTTLTWILTPILTIKFSYFGFPITTVILSLSCFYVIAVAKKYLAFKVIKNILPAGLSSCLMIVFLILMSTTNLTSLSFLIITIPISIIIYGASLTLLFKINLVSEIKNLISSK